MKREIIKAIIIFMFLVLIISSISYAMYKNEIKVTYSSVSGELICDIEVEQNDSYEVNGIPYFLVKVKNYRTNADGEKEITDVELEYNLIIRLADTSQDAELIWKKENSSDKGTEYLKQTTTNLYSLGKTEQEEVYRVFVKKTDTTTEEESINIKVELNATQKEL